VTYWSRKSARQQIGPMFIEVKRWQYWLGVRDGIRNYLATAG
jgi:hypothetical protein